jgi:CBS domain-containing membrane protein
MPELTGDESISPRAAELSDNDIYEAMKSIPGYLDITPGDFKELYRQAYQHAMQRLAGEITVKDMMVKNVVSVTPDTPLPEIAEIMGGRGISGVPVVDADNRVVGVISEKDFLSRMGAESPQNFMSVVANCLKAKGCIVLPIRAQRAKDIMSSPAIAVGESATYMEVARLFHDKSINRAPVIDRVGRLVGIVSRADIVRATQIISCKFLNL